MMSDLNTSCILCESIADDKYLLVANLDEAKFANWWFENFDVKIEKSVLQDKSGRVCNFCIQDARNSSNSDSVRRENPIDWWTVASCDSSQHRQEIMKKCVVVLERLDEEKVVPSSVASCSSGTLEGTASRNQKRQSTPICQPQLKRRRKINEDPCTNCFRYESNTPAVNERKTEHSKQQHTEDLDQGEEDCEIEEQDDLDSKFDDCDYDPYDDGDEDYDPGPDEISCEEDNEVSAVNSTNTKKDRLPEKQACDCLEANKRSPSLFQSCKFCRLDKKHPTTNTTDGENKDIEKSFDRYPAEFRHHVFVLKKSPYTYRGPLCVLCSRVLQFWGEKDARSFCLFCGKLYARVSRHLKHIHQDQQRVSDIKSINDEERRQEAFKQLAREGNYYINNKEAMETKKGFLLPTKKTAVFRHYAAMWHCDSCYTLIDKYNFSRHAESCTQRNEDRAPQPLEGSHEEFVNWSKNQQLEYLKDILVQMRDQKRAKLCLQDNNVRELLINYCYKKGRPTSHKHVRALANMCCRFLQPLFGILKINSTNQLLVSANAKLIFHRLVEMRGLASICKESQSHVNKKEGSPSQNVGRFDRFVKRLTQLAFLSANKKYGSTSRQSREHESLLKKLD